MADTDPKSATSAGNAAATPEIPESAAESSSRSHRHNPIPLPAHGFERLDQIPTSDLGQVSASEVVTRAAVLLLTAAAERLGLTPDSEPTIDLDEARPIINALAGLLAAARTDLGRQGEALVAGLQSLQDAFRNASRYPDPRGEGPGEKFLS